MLYRSLPVLLLLTLLLGGCIRRAGSEPGGLQANPAGPETGNETQAYPAQIFLPPEEATATAEPSTTPPAQDTPSTRQATNSLTAITTISPQPSLTPAPLRCFKDGGKIETGSLNTSLLRLPLVYRVYLPSCYGQEPQRRYPVLYLFHGQSFTDDQWDRMGVDETADRLIAAGEISPMIIVMPWERYGGQPTETKFSQAVVDILMPFIDEKYRTMADRDDRAVGGLSRGAGWAVHFGIGHPGLFSRVGAHSPAVFHTDAQQMRKWLTTLPEDDIPLISIDIGERDRPEIMRSALWFSEVLNEFDVPYDWHLYEGYHNEEYWSAHMESYLRWYAEGW